MENTYTYEALGTQWKITIWDTIPKNIFDNLISEILNITREFENKYSRFKDDSIVSKISNNLGVFNARKEFVDILKIYEKFYYISNKKITPLIGNTISDLGYDKDYSLTPKKEIRYTPDFDSAIKIIDETHIEIKEKILFDFGAIGKGFLIDKISDYLQQKNIQRFLVDGSGDMYYENNNSKEKIRIGLEHPFDHTKVIGIIELENGSLCSSATTRRHWREYNHYIDPSDNTSPDEIIATWVIAKNASTADALCSTLFFTKENSIDLDFEYCILDKNLALRFSKNFRAEFF
jgi:thiamine biosynthesis lipoprotein